ncbi:pectin lyase fold/virulence factor [Aspergillus heterothallicus]
MKLISSVIPPLSLLASLVSAASLSVSQQDRVAKRGPSCTPVTADNPAIDDVPAILEAIQKYGDGGVILFPEGTEYTMASRIAHSRPSESLTYWNTTREMILVHGVCGGKLHSLTGKGVIDGSGQPSYDWLSEYGKNIRRPVLLSIGGSSGISVSGIKMLNPHAVFVYVGHGSERIELSDLDMSAVRESEHDPRNTDRFDIGEASYVTLESIKIVNQDDRVAFKPGCEYVTVRNIECDGSHGLSGATMWNSSKAIVIKIYPGGSGYGTAVVRNMTWEDNYVENCDTAFQSEVCYEPLNKDRFYCEANPSSAEIKDVYVRNLTGTVNRQYGGSIGYVYCLVEREKILMSPRL